MAEQTKLVQLQSKSSSLDTQMLLFAPIFEHYDSTKCGYGHKLCCLAKQSNDTAIRAQLPAQAEEALCNSTLLLHALSLPLALALNAVQA